MLHAMPCHTPLSPALDTHFRSSIFAYDNVVGKVFISKNLFREKKKERKKNINRTEFVYPEMHLEPLEDASY